MKFFNIIVAMATFSLSGCAYQVTNLPVVKGTYQVEDIPNPLGSGDQDDKLRAGSTLFVNQTVFYRDCLVYGEHYNFEQLIGYNVKGQLQLKVVPLHHFDVEPGGQGFPPADGLHMVAGFFRPAGRYTLLVFSKSALDGSAFWPPQVETFTVSEGLKGKSYEYYPYVGLSKNDGRVRETFSEIVVLPQTQINTPGNIVQTNIDVGVLVRQGVHQLTVP